MLAHHVAGEKAFVDYSGKWIAIVDPETGEIHEAEIFVGVRGASNLTYAEATWTQQSPDRTGAHVRMLRFFGGVTKLLVSDNLKSEVNKASFYDPEINRTYGDARYARLQKSIARAKLLILDDWGPEALTVNQARDLLEIVEDRYDKGSLIITSQVPIDRWRDLIGVPTLADAILDRVIHNAYRIELAGDSLRKQSSSL